MNINIKEIISSWDNWTRVKFLNIQLKKGGIIKTPIEFIYINDENIKDKFNLNFFIENIKNDYKKYREETNIEKQKNTKITIKERILEGKSDVDYGKISQSRELINKNLKIYIQNKKLSRKIYNLHLLYLCFINSTVCHKIFDKKPSFTFNNDITDIYSTNISTKKKLGMSFNDIDNDFKQQEQTKDNITSLNHLTKIINMMHKKPQKPKIQMVNKEGLISFSPNKRTYADTDSYLRSIYHNDNEYFSSAMDILASYVKGQKLIYMEAESFCQNKLNYLMFPSIFASTTASVLASAVEKEEWGGILISSINATIAFFLSIISYLKLDAQSEAHKTSAHQYDKLQSICEFSSGNLLLFTDMKNFKELGSESKFFVELQKTINSLEAKIKEIKETNQFIIPKRIRHRYKVAYNINIFSVIKKIDGLKKHYVAFITEKINLIKMYKQQHNQLIENGNSPDSLKVMKIKQLIDQEYYERNYGYEKYQLLKSSFGIIDQLLADEIEYAEKIRRRWFCSLCPCYVKLPRPELKNTITYLITDPFTALDNRAKTTYKNYLKKMYQKYDMSKNIFAIEKEDTTRRFIPTKIGGCFGIGQKEIELQQIMKGLVDSDNDHISTYDKYNDYSCFNKKCLIFFTVIFVIAASITAVVIAIVQK